MSDVIITDKQLSSSAFSAVINAPIEQVDIADWLFNLPEAEYQRCCPPDHISAGTTSTDDGKRMSINVEMIGKTLMVQHYVAEVATPGMHAPWIAFAFPAVVALIPGSYAFRGLIGSLAIMNSGGTLPPYLLGATQADLITFVLLTCAIGSALLVVASLAGMSPRR